MQQEHPTNTTPATIDNLAGLSAVELLRVAGEPTAFHGAAPSIEAIAAAFPRLEILDLLGQGGMGFVYTARQPDLDRVVALKILRPELSSDPAFEERFSREARVLAKLNHPNIVHVFEHGQAGPYFYLMMEHVDGVNLRQAMKAGRFTPEQALAIVPGICDALHAAHAQGIWHRDIKPENILLDQDGQVKIVDFGIARIVGDPARDFTLTLTGAALGSAPYMAPEQHEKPHEVDHRADIYSLGVVFYEMLTGELPLGRFPIPSERAEVHARIDAIVMQTLEKERELRQQTATEVKTDIHRAARESAASAGEKSSAPVASRVGTWFASLSTVVRWSLVCWPMGLLLLAIGFWLDNEKVSGAAFPLSLGAAASGCGLIGGLWSLFEMRRGWMPANGRRNLVWLFLIPLLLGVGCLGVFAGICFISLIHLNLYFNYLYSVPISFATTLLLAWPIRHFLHEGLLRTRGMIISSCLVLCLALAVGKWYSYEWPFHKHRLDCLILENVDSQSISDAVFQDLFRKASGQTQAKIMLRAVSGSTTEVRFFVDQYNKPLDKSIMLTIMYRLHQLLPLSDVYYKIRGYYCLAPLEDRSFRPIFLTIVGASALAALLLCSFSLRTSGFMLAATVIATCVTVNLPDKDSEYPSIRLIPLPPFTPEQLPRDVDYSSPEAASRTLTLAHYRRQIDIMRDSVTPELADRLEQLGKWERFFEDNATRHHGTALKRDKDTNRAVSVLLDSSEEYELIDGAWKMDRASWESRQASIPSSRPMRQSLAQPQPTKPVVPKEDPIATVRLLNRLANEQNADAFLAKKYVGMFGNAFGGKIPAAQHFAPYYGEILSIVSLPSAEKSEADVVVKFKRPDSKEEYRQFDLSLEKNEWRWLSDGPPKYVAWMTVKFSPPQGNGATILKNHLGDKRMHQIDGTDHFLIGDEAYEAHEAMRLANYQHERLSDSLKQAGLDAHLTIIEPATEPKEPWMGETLPPEPEKTEP